jgi:hypothetical protein
MYCRLYSFKSCIQLFRSHWSQVGRRSDTEAGNSELISSCMSVYTLHSFHFSSQNYYNRSCIFLEYLKACNILGLHKLVLVFHPSWKFCTATMIVFKKYKCLFSSSMIYISNYKKIEHLFRNFWYVTWCIIITCYCFLFCIDQWTKSWCPK